MTNNYKVDTGKAPVVDAVFVPFGRTLLAIAEMMERQKVRHKLQGAKDPFQEWRQLPDGKSRLANAGGRHVLDPWNPNTKDRVGDHPGDLHILHAIWGLMAAYEKHLEEVDAGLVYVPGIGWMGTGLVDLPEDLATRARIELELAGESQAEPLNVPAGADWRAPPIKCGHEFPDALGRVRQGVRTCRKDLGHQGLHEDGVGLRW